MAEFQVQKRSVWVFSKNGQKSMTAAVCFKPSGIQNGKITTCRILSQNDGALPFIITPGFRGIRFIVRMISYQHTPSIC